MEGIDYADSICSYNRRNDNLWKKKIHITVTEDYITSYGNLSVKFNKGDKIWDYKSDIFESNGNKMILAHDEVFGHIIGFIPLNNTDFKSIYTGI